MKNLRKTAYDKKSGFTGVICGKNTYDDGVIKYGLITKEDDAACCYDDIHWFPAADVEMIIQPER